MELENIKDRIMEFLKAENKPSAHFAMEIGVQPSAISHIISGRNKPSLDFIVKMVNRYPYISLEWLMFGKGSMYNDDKQTDLFMSVSSEPGNKTEDLFDSGDLSERDNVKKHSDIKTSESAGTVKKSLKTSRIIMFYEDNTFSEHFPGGE